MLTNRPRPQFPYIRTKMREVTVTGEVIRKKLELNGSKAPGPDGVSTLEKDLGIEVSSNLKFSAHAAKIAAKDNSRLGIIKRNFTVLSEEILVLLYLALVHPILDYGAQSCWSPYLLRDIRSLERVQRRVTKLVPGFAQLSYEERCRRLDIQSLQNRRIRGDMIETFKLLHGYEDIPSSRFFQMNTNNLGGHSLKLKKPDLWRTTMKRNWFAIRVIDQWNSLPESVVTAPKIATFKARYNRHWNILTVLADES
ncbi:hypothetical protein Pcinc_016538 [Petrolisthes cinctipes]|uniref:Reverse transcriptase n=1 Tax=Petrolisthes cinctipes TaxID=88211 RepID=A0AAE1FR60_PETCI|nr:hypothetical protein Pcinc_016538 [Petrolisthes cinctipes]